MSIALIIILIILVILFIVFVIPTLLQILLVLFWVLLGAAVCYAIYRIVKFLISEKEEKKLIQKRVDTWLQGNLSYDDIEKLAPTHDDDDFGGDEYEEDD